MNSMWWLQIRQQLGMPRISWYAALEELHEMPIAELNRYEEEAMYGHFEGMHSYNDAQWWLSVQN